MTNYKWAHKDEIDKSVTIDWSKPVTHDMLNTGLATNNDEAYLYSIIGLFEGDWLPFYIGMVYKQDISSRHKNHDHIRRLKRLKELHPETTWHLTLGTVVSKEGRITKKLISEIEGLMIYSHWHEDSINENKINGYYGNSYTLITNKGFTDPFYLKVGYGAFISEE